MNNIKPLATIALLAAVGVGLYIKINNTPEAVPPADAGPIPSAPPLIELGEPGSPMASLGEPAPFAALPMGDAPPSVAALPSESGVAAPFVPPETSSAAPAFDPQAASLPAADARSAAIAESEPAVDNELVSQGSEAPTSDRGYSAPPDYTASTEPPTADRYGSGVTDAPIPPASRAGFPPVGHAMFSDAWNAGQELLRNGELDRALLTLSPWYRHPTLAPEEEQELTKLLGQLAGTVIYSNDFQLEPRYVAAAPGEQLSEIALRYDVPVELLARINGLSETARVAEGEAIKVVRGPFSAVVDAANRELVLLLAGRYAGRFEIGIGQERRDIEGEFTVSTKLLNPPYLGTDQQIDAGSPDNPLGGHWIGLKDASGAAAGPFGIHGTNDPASLSSDPRGFIRLEPQDAEHAFYILGRGSTVTIRR